jgi:hypothetical protein
MHNRNQENWLALAKDLDALALRCRAQAGESAPQSAPPPRSASPTPARPPPRGGGPVCKFGRNQGVPLAELSDSDLTWLGDALARSVTDPAKSAYRAKNIEDLEDVRAEQRLRGAAG